ncbi:MAG: replication-associated recombination protein A [Candidatus Margulisiibacteriota bacterium]
MELFAEANKETNFRSSPLAIRMQPRTIDDVFGQEHILGPGKPLRLMIEADKIQSLIFFGPPGCGKTALAHVIARRTQAEFVKLNAVIAKVDDLRQVIKKAKDQRVMYGKRTIVFIDELHRFNKSQQDALLPDVEDGTIILIGATTQNPFHSVISALVSRSQVFRFEELSTKTLAELLKNSLKDERGLKEYNIQADDEALEFLAARSQGDARKALNALELGVITKSHLLGPLNPSKGGLDTPFQETDNHSLSSQDDSNYEKDNTRHTESTEISPPLGGFRGLSTPELQNSRTPEPSTTFTLADAEEAIQSKAVVYDENEHYDVISAFIKSMRGSNPDAAVYWLAKMLYAGEDPAFIARRIVICASEDVGMADPQALVVANAARETVEFIGMPEARIPLAQAAIYVACAPKSNASYLAIDEALADVKSKPAQRVPDHLRNAVYKGEKELGIGKDYKYAHSYGGYVPQDYMPEPKIYYKPTENGIEKRIKEKLDKLRIVNPV